MARQGVFFYHESEQLFSTDNTSGKALVGKMQVRFWNATSVLL